MGGTFFRITDDDGNILPIVELVESLGCVLKHEFPPIPSRNCDWSAHHKDHDGKPIEAYGATKEEAAMNWFEWYLENCDE